MKISFTKAERDLFESTLEGNLDYWLDQDDSEAYYAEVLSTLAIGAKLNCKNVMSYKKQYYEVLKEEGDKEKIGIFCELFPMFPESGAVSATQEKDGIVTIELTDNEISLFEEGAYNNLNYWLDESDDTELYCEDVAATLSVLEKLGTKNIFMFASLGDSSPMDIARSYYGILKEQGDEKKLKLFEKIMPEAATRYFGITQNYRGGEYRWIYDEKTLSEKMFDGETVPENSKETNIKYPMSGGDCSFTSVRLLENDDDIKLFLSDTGNIIKNDDPTLYEIGRHCLHIHPDDHTDDNSDRFGFAEKFGLSHNDLHKYDDRSLYTANTLKMVKALELVGYTDFDYKEPFYGKNENMHFSELCDLYKDKVIDKFKLKGMANKAIDGSLSVNTYYDEGEKTLHALVCFSRQNGDHIAVAVKRPDDFSAETGCLNVDIIDLPRPIGANYCNYNPYARSNQEKWVYHGLYLCDYEAVFPRNKIVKFAEKKKLSVYDVDEIKQYYDKLNFDLNNKTDIGKYTVNTVKEMMKDGFSTDRILLIGKNRGVAATLKDPRIKWFVKLECKGKTR